MHYYHSQERYDLWILITVRLKCINTDSQVGIAVKVKRFNNEIAPSLIFSLKTMKKTTAIFFVIMSSISFLQMDCKEDPINPFTDCPLPIDTTSHNFTWQIDTIGTFQSYLRDTWGSDTNNVYAVGFIYWPDRITPYNIIKWNGTNWRPVSYLEGDLNSIYGFGPNDIWVAGFWQLDNNFFPLISHWNGSQWQTWKMQEFSFLTSIWGTSTNNMYACGGNGTILHYDGTTWSKMESGTTIRLSDCWGNSKTNEMYFVGGNASTGEGVLVYFNEKKEKKVIQTSPQYNDTSLYGRLLGVRGVNDSTIYIVGPHAFTGRPSHWKEIILNNDNTIMEKVRGKNNNLFITGSFSLILHFNGSNWFRYDQFYRKPDGDFLVNTWESKKKVFKVGQTGTSRGVIYRGRQQ